ncbi:hypothetical protein [Bordetella bronchialis]|uniref:DUF3318 domain-containing protein n=1 Tax=Bordetella bronchialis TaxID=463025 RepID=A0A193FSL8_9BORD|nr:hypothetical protein [Bordetella bronchialis]ANN65712.1 hypothetical protein BAU06_04870 [Bordetella bronchialis]ANN70742.1 hypothetical protein BAU08_04840 [Bordetella bronchialis]
MSKMSPEVDRQVRIELLRARAAVEREALVHNVAGLTASLSPSHLVKGLVPRLSAGNMPMMAWQAFSVVRRYPVIMSTLSAIFLRGKRSRLLKLATAGAVGWQVYRGWRARQASDAATQAVTNPVPPTSRPLSF